ncbi:hypothetical protein Y032_0057g2777 [Ancylostoma ceylanicum]|uniref:Uncharacterized protein n=1 Tax=Ancylostoma ceylanicum TaxID=53326 RepID=A0A016U5L3_9BILA|nr:hypothetical protein Y032_0057g2777 [Ancylostoma ceylanicum]
MQFLIVTYCLLDDMSVCAQVIYYFTAHILCSRPVGLTTSEVYLRAYKSYVRPVVESGITISNPFKKKDINLLESVQNSFTRKLMMRCFGMNYDQVPNGEKRCKILGLPTLQSRRIVADLTMTFKILKGKLSSNLTEFFEVSMTRTIIGKLKLNVPVARLRARSKFLTYRVLNEFSLLLAKNEHLLELSLQSFRKLVMKICLKPSNS